MEMAEVWSIFYGIGGLLFGMLAMYIIHSFMNPFEKARLMSRVLQKTFAVAEVETDNMEIQTLVFPIEKATISMKNMDHEYIVDRNMFRRKLGIPTIGFHYSNRTATHYRPIDVDYHHVLVPEAFRISIPQQTYNIPTGLNKKGEIEYKQVVEPGKPIDIPAQNVFPDMELSDSPYRGLKEIRALAKVITYKTTGSPKTFSSYIKATDVEAEIRASQQRNKIIEGMKTLLMITVVLVGFVVLLSVYLAWNQSSMNGKLDTVTYGMNALNETMRNSTVRILAPMNYS